MELYHYILIALAVIFIYIFVLIYFSKEKESNKKEYDLDAIFKLLDKISELDESKKMFLERMVLRTLTKAVYSIENFGHFGLFLIFLFQNRYEALSRN